MSFYDHFDASHSADTHLGGVESTFFQVGYVVPDVTNAIRSLLATMPVSGYAYFAKADLRKIVYLDRSIESTMSIGLAYTSTLQLEFVQPISGGGLHADYLTDYPQGGLHHLGFVSVEAGVFKADCRRLNSGGFSLLYEGELSESARFAYFDARGSLGSFLELVLADDKLLRLYGAIREGRLNHLIKW